MNNYCIQVHQFAILIKLVVDSKLMKIDLHYDVTTATVKE